MGIAAGGLGFLHGDVYGVSSHGCRMNEHSTMADQFEPMANLSWFAEQTRRNLVATFLCRGQATIGKRYAE